MFAAALIYSLGVSAIGAMTTVMYPMPDSPYAPAAQLIELVIKGAPTYRLMGVGIAIMLVGIVIAKRAHLARPS